jgi:hypothetical protein
MNHFKDFILEKSLKILLSQLVQSELMYLLFLMQSQNEGINFYMLEVSAKSILKTDGNKLVFLFPITNTIFDRNTNN